MVNQDSTGERRVGELVPQPHGGKLLHGNPGNRGGGRPKDRIRSIAASAGINAVNRLRNLLNDEREAEKLTPKQLSDIADMMLKYSIGTKTEIDVRVADPEIVSKATEVAVQMGLDAGEYRNRLLEMLDGLSEWDVIEEVVSQDGQ